MRDTRATSGTPPTAEPRLAVGQVAALLGVCPMTVNRYVHAGRLPAIRTPGGKFRIRFADVVDFLNPVEPERAS